MWLELTVVPFPPRSLFMMVMLPLPPEILLKVFPVIVLVGPLADETPSALFQPPIAVAPVTVTWEKSLPVWVMVVPLTEWPAALKNVTVPPAPPLSKAATMRLLLQISKPGAAMSPDRLR